MLSLSRGRARACTAVDEKRALKAPRHAQTKNRATMLASKVASPATCGVLQMSGSIGQSRKELYEFGPFRVDPDKHLLLREGEAVALTPKTFQVLLVLIRHKKQIVTKQDLMKAVWPETFVEESNLSRSISMLRKALGETAQDHGHVVTIPGRGYRFAEDVHLVPEQELSIIAARYSRVQVQVEERNFRRWIYAAACCVLLLLGIAGYRVSPRLEKRNSNGKVWASGSPSIAVLPLENLSADPAQEYFAEGITDELTTRLAKLPGLKVISRTSASQYRTQHKSVPEIGRKLSADVILEGTVERSNKRIRLRVQLIQAATDQHLWAESYDYELSNVQVLETEFARDIARQIEIHVAPQNSESERAVDPTAFEDFLKGRYFWNRRDGGGLVKAVQYFQRATQEDANYAAAYAGLAQSYILLPDPVRAKEAADKALAIDPLLADAHTAMALIAEQDWDFPTAEQEYKRAISLNPNYATAHHWYGEGYLALMGRFTEADHEMEEARSLDPVSRIIATDCGAVFYMERQYDKAYRQLTSVLEMEPGFSEALIFRALTLLKQQKYTEAIADLEKASQIDPRPRRLAILGFALGLAGQRSGAASILQKLKAMSQGGYVEPWAFATVHIGLNNKDLAFAWLEKAYSERSGDLRALKVDPAYDSLRDDPRFNELMKRVGLPQ